VSELPEQVEQAPGLEVHEAQDGLVVFNPATDRVHHLNSTAAALFELCAEARSGEELTNLITDLYELENPPAEAVDEGLRQLLAEGVLVSSSEGSGG
jgi:hypothetical protein